ncbi:hypothetical protein D3C81_2115470 [compost metagenome]
MARVRAFSIISEPRIASKVYSVAVTFSCLPGSYMPITSVLPSSSRAMICDSSGVTYRWGNLRLKEPRERASLFRLDEG